MDVVQIEGSPNLIRDLHSKAVLNTDNKELNRYKTQQKIVAKNDQLQQDVEYLKTEMSEIKEMLTLLLQQKQG